jgi:uncharacterized protein (DUF58 family)
MPIDLKQIASVANLEFLAKKVVEGFITGLHRSPFHGFSVEFAEHRQYRAGESTRFIDWKLYARTDKLFVKRFEEETNLRCFFVIDTSSSMYFPENEDKNRFLKHKAAFSALAAAALSELMRRQRDATGLCLFEENTYLNLAAKTSITHQRQVFAELEKCIDRKPEKGRTTDLIKNLHLLAEQLPRRSVIVLFTDAWTNANDKTEDILDCFRHLKHQRHEIILFHVTDKAMEINLDLPDRPYRFIDVESGQEVKTHLAGIKEAYKTATEQYLNTLKMGCARYGVDWIEADMALGLDPILMGYLAKRRKFMGAK